MTKRLIVPLIGTGTDADPFRVDLPNYTLIDCDYEAGKAVVDVPDPPPEEPPAPVPEGP